jgi:hypothetical protein
MSRTKNTILIATLTVATLVSRTMTGQVTPSLDMEPGAPFVVAVADEAGTPLAVVYVGTVPTASGQVVSLRLPGVQRMGLTYVVVSRFLWGDVPEVTGRIPDVLARPQWDVGRVQAVMIPSPATPLLGTTGWASLQVSDRGLELEPLATPTSETQQAQAEGGPCCYWFGSKAPPMAAMAILENRVGPGGPGNHMTLAPGAVRRGVTGRTDGRPSDFGFGGGGGGGSDDAARRDVQDAHPVRGHFVDGGDAQRVRRATQGTGDRVDGMVAGGSSHASVARPVDPDPILGTAAADVLKHREPMHRRGLTGRAEGRPWVTPAPPKREQDPFARRPIRWVPFVDPTVAPDPFFGSAPVTLVVTDQGLGVVFSG